MIALILIIISYLFRLYSYALILVAFMSWIPNARLSVFYQFLNRITRPYLDFFDRLLPTVGNVSFSVIVALFALQLIQRGIISLVYFLGGR